MPRCAIYARIRKPASGANTLRPRHLETYHNNKDLSSTVALVYPQCHRQTASSMADVVINVHFSSADTRRPVDHKVWNPQTLLRRTPRVICQAKAEPPSHLPSPHRYSSHFSYTTSIQLSHTTPFDHQQTTITFFRHPRSSCPRHYFRVPPFSHRPLTCTTLCLLRAIGRRTLNFSKSHGLEGSSVARAFKGIQHDRRSNSLPLAQRRKLLSQFHDSPPRAHNGLEITRWNSRIA